MEDKSLDEFDHFCRIAKNPILVSDEYNKNHLKEYSNLHSKNFDLGITRSHSVRERVPQNLREHKEETSNSIKQEDNKIVRVRSFRRTTKGIVCNKDTLEIQSDQLQVRDNNQPISVSCETAKNDTKPLLGEKDNGHYVINIIGAYGVGKSSLCQQLLIPEYQVTQYDECNSRNEAQIIRVLVDNQESLLKLNEIDNYEFSLMKADICDAYIAMFAIDDKASFEMCRKALASIVLTVIQQPVVILVGNKSDLARSRVISEDEGKRLANVYNLKFKEISTSLNHCVDELLVLLVTEIRNFYRKIEKQKSVIVPKRFHDSQLRSSLRIKVPHNAVSRFIQKHFNKSYDNVSINN